MEGVRILWAGYGLSSRTLGTDHVHSDHDVKAIFVHHESRYFGIKPLTHALRHKFNIEVGSGPVEVDISGWEARHLCQLLSKSNPTVIAALRSPIVFRSSHWVEKLLALQQATIDWAAVSRAWQRHANGNYKQNILAVEAPQRKKYIHVLQALLCLQWLRLRTADGSRRGGWPPLRIIALLDDVTKGGLLSAVESATVSSLIDARDSLVQALPRDEAIDSLIERLLASDVDTKEDQLCLPALQRQRSPATDWDDLCSAMVSETSKF
jgi:predicted nucleotidyltransferase